MMRRVLLTCSLALVLTALIAGGALCAKNLVIQISDDLDMKNTKATKVSDQICLPVRAVAESMGATIKWDDKSHALTVSCKSGTAVLRLGDTAATINGTKVNLPIAPFLNDGRLFAPLGFYNRFFDMGLVWDPFRQAYRWTFILPPAPYPVPPVIYGPGSGGRAAAPPSQAAESRRRVAEVIRVDPSASSITVVAGSRTATYSVSRNAVVLRGRVGSPAAEVTLSDVRRGDRVTLTIRGDGVVTSIRAQYQEIRGVIDSISDDRIVLDSGRRLMITDRTRVVLPGNARGRIEDLAVGDQVIVAVSPISGDAYLIAVQRTAQESERQSNIYLNSYGPLTVGDILRVMFRASVGGRATFTIPGLLTNAPMAETSPGIYEAQFTVKPGDILPSERIKVSFVPKDGTLYETLSGRPVTIATESAYLPRIVSPRTGEEIGSPIVVSGIAHPNARVRVTVEFLRNVQGLMPLQGLTGAQDVRAGADGVWRTGPLPATVPWDDLTIPMPNNLEVLDDLYEFKEYPTTFIITATEIGPDGVELSSYQVQAERHGGYPVGL